MLTICILHSLSKYSFSPSYEFYFYTVPHLTAFYRILLHPTLSYRILPIRVPLSARGADKEQQRSGKGPEKGGDKQCPLEDFF